MQRRAQALLQVWREGEKPSLQAVYPLLRVIEEVPVDGIILTAKTSSIFLSGSTATATGWGIYIGTTLLHSNV